MTLAQYDTYFQEMAGRLAAIRHTVSHPRYAHYHIEEVIVGMRADLDLSDFCLLQEDISGQLQSKSDEAVNDMQTGAILIIKHVAQDDFAGERIVLDQALKIAKQVMARMILDKRLAVNGQKPANLRGLNVSAFYYEKAQNIFDHCFGYRLEYQYASIENLIIDPEEWIPDVD
jgi:hypothetical protein